MFMGNHAGMLHIVGGGGSGSTVSCPVCVEELASWRIDSFVRVSTKEVSLSLQEVGWQSGSSKAVIICEGRSYAGKGNSMGSSSADSLKVRSERHFATETTHLSPSMLSFTNGTLEVLVEEEIRKLCVFVEGFLNLS